MTASPYPCRVSPSSRVCGIPLCSALLSLWAALVQLGGDGTHLWGRGTGTGLQRCGEAREGNEEGKVSREGLGCSRGVCAAHKGQEESAGQEGEDVVSLERGGQVLPLPVPPSPSQTYYSWVWDALYLAAEAKPCLKIKAQSS